MATTQYYAEKKAEDHKKKLFCAFRHFPELRRSLAESARLHAESKRNAGETNETRKLRQAGNTAKTRKTAEELAVEECRRKNAKFRELCASVLVEVDDQYADLKGYMREHRERYREERRCHLKLLESAQDKRRNSVLESDAVPSVPTTPLYTCASKLTPAGIFIDIESTLVNNKYDELALASEIKSSGLRQVLGLPPYVTIPDEVMPAEQSSKPCQPSNRPSWRPPTQNEKFQKLMRDCLEVILCVRLTPEELTALFTALYGSGFKEEGYQNSVTLSSHQMENKSNDYLERKSSFNNDIEKE